MRPALLHPLDNALRPKAASFGLSTLRMVALIAFMASVFVGALLAAGLIPDRPM